MKPSIAVFALLFVSCTPTKDAETIEFERGVRENLDGGNFVMVSIDIDDRIKAQGADKVAPLVAGPIVAKWAEIEKAELENAATMGKDRALGRTSDHCVGCTIFLKTIRALAPASPEIDSRWKTLQPKLEKAEVIAYDLESNDNRPMVVVWQQASGGTTAAIQIISMCVTESLKKSFPKYKWISEDKAPGADKAQFELVGKAALDKYVDSRTQKEAAQLMSGLRVRLMPRNLDATLSSRFTEPLEAQSTVNSPDTIRQDLPIGGPPTMETVRAGMKQLQQIRDEVCGTFDKAIQQAAAADKAAPVSSQKAVK